MSRCALLVLALGLSLSAPPGPVEAAGPPTPGPRLDRAGDPLPPRARARLGTLRWRALSPVTALAFSPDGKTVAGGCAQGTVHLWEAPSGRELRRWQAKGPPVSSVTFMSGDVLLVRGRFGMSWWDVKTGKEIANLRAYGWVPEIVAVSGDTMAIVAAPPWADDSGVGNPAPRQVVYLWGAATGQPIRQVKLACYRLAQVAVSPDGRLLATRSQGEPGLPRVWDARTGKKLPLHCPVPKRVRALPREGPALGVVRRQPGPAGEASRILWDEATGAFLGPDSERREEATRFELDPDGRSVALLLPDRPGRPAAKERSPGAVVGKGSQPTAFSPNRKWAVTGEGQCLRLWDVDTGKARPPGEGHTSTPTVLHYLGDGKRLLSCAPAGGDLRVWGAARGKVLFRGAKGQSLLGVSGGGTVGAVWAGPGEGVLLRDTVSFNEVGRLGKGKPDRPLVPVCVAFAPGERSLAVLGWRAERQSFEWGLQLHDRATGKTRWERPAVEVQGPDGGEVSASGRLLAFSPDGRWLAARTGAHAAAPILLWGARTGAPWPRRPQAAPQGGHFAFTPAVGLLIAGGGPSSAPNDRGAAFLRIWELSTGKALVTLERAPANATCLALSRDGRHLAVGAESGAVVLWDLLADREAGRLEGHRGAVRALAFSPDGRELAAAADDTTILVWDVDGLLRGRKARPLPEAQVAALWSRLEKGDGLEAVRAAWALAEAPEAAVPFLAKRLRPAVPVEARRLARLVAELDSDTFAARERATRELEAVGSLAEPALRAALRGRPSLELALRARGLLERIEEGGLPQREACALLVLEACRGEAARLLLAELAGGAPAARLTQQARAALERRGGA
jgi:WD40 repeat protein